VNGIDPLGLADDRKPLNLENCNSLRRIIDTEREYGKNITSIIYNPLNFSDYSVSLDAAYPSVGGLVSIDWMMRSGMGGVSSHPIDTRVSYIVGKSVNNLLNKNNPVLNMFGEANWNAPSAYSYWMRNNTTLEVMFAHSLEECKCVKY
jgi:hypothetical protein